MAAALRFDGDESPVRFSSRGSEQPLDIYASRGEDPPTRVDAVLKVLMGLVQVVCMLTCLLGLYLFSLDNQTPSKPVAAVMCGALAGGFGVQAVRSFSKSAGMFKVAAARARGFDVE